MAVTDQIISVIEDLAEEDCCRVLRLAEALRQRANDDARLGETGERVAASVWPADDFSDWPTPDSD